MKRAMVMMMLLRLESGQLKTGREWLYKRGAFAEEAMNHSSTAPLTNTAAHASLSQVREEQTRKCGQDATSSRHQQKLVLYGGL